MILTILAIVLSPFLGMLIEMILFPEKPGTEKIADRIDKDFSGPDRIYKDAWEHRNDMPKDDIYADVYNHLDE